MTEYECYRKTPFGEVIIFTILAHSREDAERAADIELELENGPAD